MNVVAFLLQGSLVIFSLLAAGFWMSSATGRTFPIFPPGARQYPYCRAIYQRIRQSLMLGPLCVQRSPQSLRRFCFFCLCLSTHCCHAAADQPHRGFGEAQWHTLNARAAS